MTRYLRKLLPVKVSAAEGEQEIKATFLNSVFCLAGVVAFAMGFIRWRESVVLGMFDFGFSGSCLALLLYLRRHREKIEALSSAALILSFILFFAIYLLAPSNPSRVALFFLLSASAFFLKGRRSGFFWLLFILLSIVTGYFIPNLAIAYSPVDLLTTCLYLVALFVIFSNYERIRETQSELLEQQQNRLEAEVAQRTAELLEANRLLSEELGARKRAEAEICKLSSSVEQSPATIVITDTNGNIEYVNPAFTLVTGYAAAEVVGKNPRILQSGKTAPEEYARLWATIKAGNSWQGEFCNRKKGGELYWEAATIAPITSPVGVVTHYVAIKEDITERKKAVEALRQSEERLNAAQRIAQIGSWELDIVHNHLSWSAEVYRIFEIEPAEFGASYEAFLELVHPDDRAAVNSAYTQAKVNHTPFMIEHRILFPDGRIKYVWEQDETFYDGEGQPLRSLGTVQDITARRKIEDELRLAKEEWERTFDAIADPIMILDLDYRVVKANKALAAALNITVAEALGRPCYQLIHGSEEPPPLCPHAELLKDGQAYAREVVQEKLGGHFLESVSPLCAADGRLIGSIHAARDITALKKAEELKKKYADDLEQLLDISRQITTTTELAGLYRLFVSTARERLALDFSTLLLLSEDKQALVVQDTLGFPASTIGRFSLVEGQGLSTLVVKSKTPETVRDFDCETRFEVPAINWQHNIVSAVAVPMMMQDDIVGVLIGHTSTRRDFSANDISLYQQIANQAAVAIQNARNTERLISSEKKIRDITSALGEGLYVLDGQGLVTFMNPEAERLLGWSEGELLGREIHDIVHHQSPGGSALAAADCPVHKVISTGKRFSSRDELFIRKDGVAFPVSLLSAPLLEKGAVTASITVFRDISEQKMLEEEREKLIGDLQKALGEIKTLQGILPICCVCKKIRDDAGAWTQIEGYIRAHSAAQFSHSYCPQCYQKAIAEFA